MSADEKKFIADNYNDCLCRRCLGDIKTECRQDAIDRKLQPMKNRMIARLLHALLLAAALIALITILTLIWLHL